MAYTHEDRLANSAKGGKIGGPKSPTSFAKNPQLAAAAGAKSKRGPARIKCDWCGDPIMKGTLMSHAKAEHPNLYRKYFEQEENSV